jgi:hypothetical protein
MGLLDTIHAFYIEALARLPRAALPRLVRGLLIAGHCYGPMDPVSNIIVHAVWYSVVVPAPLHHGGEPADILGAADLLRLEVRSLDGLVASVRAVTGFSEHGAVEYLCTSRCDISAMLQGVATETRAGAFGRASAAARYPLGNHHSSFLASLASGKPALLDTLTSLLSYTGVQGLHWLSDESITELQSVLGDYHLCITPVPASLRHQTELDSLLSGKKSLEKTQRFLRTELGQLLLIYTDRHPWVCRKN